MTEPSRPIRPGISYQRDAIWNVRDLRLFETLTPRQLRKLTPLFEERHYRQGEVLFTAGETAERLYFVKEGAVKVSVSSREGDEHVLDIFKPGTPLANSSSPTVTSERPRPRRCRPWLSGR